MPNSATTQQYQARDQLLLRHAASFKILLAPVISKLYFESNACAHVLKRMTDAGLLNCHARALPGGFTAFTLTTTGAKVAGISSAKSNTLPTGAVLDLAVALNVFCALGTHRRFLLEPREREALELPIPPNVACVLSDELRPEPQVFRVFHATSDVHQAVKAVSEELSRMQTHRVLREWLAAADIGVSVLVPTISKRDAIRKIVDRNGLAKEGPLLVELGPTASTLSNACKNKGA